MIILKKHLYKGVKSFRFKVIKDNPSGDRNRGLDNIKTLYSSSI
jgi:hypothetical protein